MNLMKYCTFLPAVLLCGSHLAAGQANPTATQRLQISAFGGLTGTYTGLEGGRNLGITAGADLDIYSFHNFVPGAEVRGTYPIHEGQIDGQEDLLAGIKVHHPWRAFQPYADFLIGRGQISYKHGGFKLPPYIYIASTSVVFSPGVGVDLDLSHRWAAKADFQYQTWNTPVSFTGTIHPRVLTAGLVYRFDFNHH